jgi:DNA mismatch repair protein MutL
MSAKEIIRAAKRGDAVAARVLLEADRSLARVTESEGTTPLHCAAWKGHVEVAELLLEAGADIDAVNQDAHYGGTPLHAAAHGNQKPVVELLIRRGAALDVELQRAHAAAGNLVSQRQRGREAAAGRGRPGNGWIMAEPRIRILAPEVAEQIAAGEVVERPASVVKELVENALDAGARRITVETEAGGKALLRITDDGCGMSPKEVLLALQRHATSKLRSADDLFDIRTLGFRGEALPSIAAVSEMEILTRTAEAEEGCRTRIEGGVVREQAAAPATVGTQITIRRLFFNVPVRERFMRSDVAEGGHITEWLQRLALSHSDVTFRLVHDGRQALLCPGSQEPLNAVVSILGRGVARDLIRLASSEAEGRIQVSGFAGRPTLTRSSRTLQHVYVNGRAVRSPVVTRALDEAFRSTMPSGRYPVVVLFLQIPAGEVDVNVHPAKTEVRFQDEGAIHQAVKHAVLAALRSQVVADTPPLPGAEMMYPSASEPSRALIAEPTAPTYAPPDSETRPFAEAALALPTPCTRPETGGSWRPQRTYSPPSRPEHEEDPFDEYPASRALERRDRSDSSEPLRLASAEQPAIREPQSIAPVACTDAIPALTYLGQSQDLFIFAVGDGKLWIIDQHVAHERVLFDRLTAPGVAAEPAEPLLMPITLEVDRPRALALEDHRGLLDELGFVVEPFGPGRFVMRAAPRSLIGLNYERVFHDLADELAEQTQGGQVRLRKDEVAMAAAGRSCKSAVKAGQRLSEPEIQRLLEDLRHARNPHTCPHGRPVFLSYNQREIERMFGAQSCA